MLSSKEIFCREHERLTAEAEDAGMSFEDAYESTADAAWGAAQDRYAEMVDQARMRAKEGL